MFFYSVWGAGGEKYGFNAFEKTDLNFGGNLLFTSLKSCI